MSDSWEYLKLAAIFFLLCLPIVPAMLTPKLNDFQVQVDGKNSTPLKQFVKGGNHIANVETALNLLFIIFVILVMAWVTILYHAKCQEYVRPLYVAFACGWIVILSIVRLILSYTSGELDSDAIQSFVKGMSSTDSEKWSQAIQAAFTASNSRKLNVITTVITVIWAIAAFKLAYCSQ